MLPYTEQAVVGDVADSDGIQPPLVKNVVQFLLATLVGDEQHTLLRFAEHDLVGGHGCLALRNSVEFDFHTSAAARPHFAARTGKSGGSHILDADNKAFLHGLQTSLEQQLFHERIADLNVGPLGAGVFAESGRRHRGPVNAVTAGLRADVNDGIADAGGASIEDFVFLEDAKGKRVYQRILGIAVREHDLSADCGHAEAVSVEGDSADNTFHDAPILRVAERTEAQTVHRGDRPSAHRENVAKDAPNAGGCTLKRLDVRRVVMRFDLEGNGKPVSDVDDAGIFAGSLKHRRTFCRQPLQMDAGTLVAAVLAPHHTEDAEFRDGGFALQDADDALVFGVGETVLRELFRSDHGFLKIQSLCSPPHPRRGGRDTKKRSRSHLTGADGVVLVKKSWPTPPRLRDMVASQLLLDRASTPPRLRRGVRAAECLAQ